MSDLLLRSNILDAAIRHAKKNARTPKDRRACVLFYLKVEQQVARKARAYTYANACRVLLSQCEQAELITTLLETLRAYLQVAEHANGDPHSNTGPTAFRRSKVYGSLSEHVHTYHVKHSAHDGGSSTPGEA